MMEELFKFFEQYWGYTIIGGFTIGALITNIIAIIKVVITNKIKNTQCDSVINTANTLQEKLEKKDEAYDLALQNLKTAHEQYRKEQERREQEFKHQIETVEGRTQQIVSVLFTSVSYIIMGSKLDDETKLSVLNKMNALLNTNTPEGAVNSVKEIMSESISNYTGGVVTSPAKEEKEVEEQIAEAATTAQTLFDKYSSNNNEV